MCEAYASWRRTGDTAVGLSAVVITLNEEKNIDACLRGLAFADEIVVVDSFSTDRTVEIARQHTDKVSSRHFTGFSDQKSAAIELAQNDWILIVDADEVVTGDLAAEIQAAVKNGDCDAYRIPRLSYFLGRPIRHCGWYPDYQLRLARRGTAHFADRLVHETLETDRKCGTFKHDLIHYTYRDMDDVVRKTVSYSRAGALQKVRQGTRCRLSDLLFRPGLAFLKKYVLKQGFRDGLHGFILSGLGAYEVFLKYAILWDITRRPGPNKEKTDHD